MDARVFDQESHWLDADGILHRIVDISDAHLKNTIDFLVMAPDLCLREYRHFADVPTGTEPQEWVESTVVMKALRAEAARRGIEVPS